MKHILKLSTALVLVFVVAGCSDNEKSAEAPKVETADPAVSSTTDSAVEPESKTTAISEMGSIESLFSSLKAGADGSVEAAKLVGEKRLSEINNLIGSLGKSEDPTEKAASHALLEAAYEKNGNENLGVRLAVNYADGKGVSKDQAKAMDILTQDKFAENKSAIYHRARILMAKDYQGQDRVAAKLLLEKSASMDFAPAKKLLSKFDNS